MPKWQASVLTLKFCEKSGDAKVGTATIALFCVAKASLALSLFSRLVSGLANVP